MNDRELLELAAKAAKVPVIWDEYRQGFFNGLNTYSPKHWNPLADDGDALRLAVKLNMEIHISDYDVLAYASGAVQGHGEELRDDPCGATRRAIVRAAAQVGKDVK